jgi:hypothetical protein
MRSNTLLGMGPFSSWHPSLSQMVYAEMPIFFDERNHRSMRDMDCWDEIEIQMVFIILPII